MTFGDFKRNVRKYCPFIIWNNATVSVLESDVWFFIPNNRFGIMKWFYNGVYIAQNLKYENNFYKPCNLNGRHTSQWNDDCNYYGSMDDENIIKALINLSMCYKRESIKAKKIQLEKDFQ